MAPIEYVRFVSGPDGVSRIEKGLRIPFELKDFVPPSPPIGVSAVAAASQVAFLSVPAGFDGGWHPSPRRLWIFCLSGNMRMEAGDGQVHTTSPGDAVLLEDTDGHGHYSRVVSDVPTVFAAVQL
jgi:Cupin domain